MDPATDLAVERLLWIAAGFALVGALFVAGMSVLLTHAVRGKNANAQRKYICACEHRLHQHGWDVGSRCHASCDIAACPCERFTPRQPTREP
jgi:hypothetical protein